MDCGQWLRLLPALPLTENIMSKITFTKDKDTKFIDATAKEVIEELKTLGWKTANTPKKDKA